MYGETPEEYGEYVDTPMGGIVHRRKPKLDVPVIEMSEEGKKAIVEALKAEIETVLKKEPLGAAEFQQVRRLADLGRDMVASGLPTRGRLGSGAVTGPIPLGTNGLYTNDETYGAKLIRELVAALPGLVRPPPSPDQLVLAAAEARDRGMTSLAQKIEKQLLDRIDPKLPDLPAPGDEPADKEKAAE